MRVFGRWAGLSSTLSSWLLDMLLSAPLPVLPRGELVWRLQNMTDILKGSFHRRNGREWKKSNQFAQWAPFTTTFLFGRFPILNTLRDSLFIIERTSENTTIFHFCSSSWFMGQGSLLLAELYHCFNFDSSTCAVHDGLCSLQFQNSWNSSQWRSPEVTLRFLSCHKTFLQSCTNFL